MGIKKKIVEKKMSSAAQKKEDMKKGSPAKMAYGKSPAKMKKC